MDRKEHIDAGSTATDRIAGVLAPYLGPHMTKASIEMYKKRLGISEISTSAQCDELIALLVPGLMAFVGEEKSTRLAAEMRNAAKGD